MVLTKSIRLLKLMSALSAALAIPAAAQTFDTSGNGKLNGPFFVRQVATTNLNSATSAIGEAISVIGIMTFDGQGNYTFIGIKRDTADSTGTGQAFTTTGTYAVESNGMAQIQNPISNKPADTEYGGVTGVGPVSIVASSTEGAFNDVFVAIQAGTQATNNSVNGSYTMGFIDFLQAEVSQVRDGYFTFSSAGTGSLGSIMVHGAMANQNSADVTQTLAGVTYSVNNLNGAGQLTFPTASSVLTSLVSGAKTFYVSADGSLLLGGDPNGFDLLIGIKSNSGAAANSMFQGTYYAAGLENDASDEANGNDDIDSFYGSTLALGGQGVTTVHDRLTFFDEFAFDYTADGFFDFAADGTFNDGVFQHFLGVNGLAELSVGSSTTYSLSVNLAAPSSQATSVFLNPLSIFNAASFAPITNAVAPGEIITIFGSGLASDTFGAQTLPLPKTLGQTQVTVNGIAAPLLYVSQTQINFLVPSAVSPGVATFQVTNNNVKSNEVTVYADLTAPGIFTQTSNGVGPAAVTHLDYSLVTENNPAVAGEILILYLTGLGSVTPPVPDGAAGPANPSNVDEYTNGSLSMDIFDSMFVDTSVSVGFAGTAPGFAGLYQINFTVPSGVASGQAYLDISTNEAYNSEAKIFIK